MTPQELLLLVFCTVDDEIQASGGPPRRPGPRPKLSDGEVITIELVGELWGIADDAAIYRHFRRHYLAEFPALAQVDRSRFVRHAADLCWLARRLQRRLAEAFAGPGDLWLVDSCPLPVCRFGRAGYCRRFRGQAAYGFDPLARKAFYGFRFHLRVALSGVVLGYELAPADAHELELAREPAPSPAGVGIGDRNDWSPATRADFQAAGGDLLAPFKQREHDPDPARSERLLAWRRRIETVFSQLIERFDLRRIKVRDLWHLEHRIVRKLLALTVAAWLNVAAGRSPLQLAPLVA